MTQFKCSQTLIDNTVERTYWGRESCRLALSCLWVGGMMSNEFTQGRVQEDCIARSMVEPGRTGLVPRIEICAWADLVSTHTWTRSLNSTVKCRLCCLLCRDIRSHHDIIQTEHVEEQSFLFFFPPKYFYLFILQTEITSRQSGRQRWREKQAP